MLNEQTRFPNNFSQITLYSLAPNNGDVSGILYHEATGNAWRFASLVRMVFLLEALFDSTGFPQRTHRDRELIDGANERSKIISAEDRVAPEDIPDIEHPFISLRVTYRQNTSWQGVVKRADIKGARNFRSAFELMLLISDAVAPEADPSWTE